MAAGPRRALCGVSLDLPARLGLPDSVLGHMTAAVQALLKRPFGRF